MISAPHYTDMIICEGSNFDLGFRHAIGEPGRSSMSHILATEQPNFKHHNLWVFVLSNTDLLADQLQRLHLQLPELTFNPATDTASKELPGADIYLNHYSLARLSEPDGIAHYLGANRCCNYTIACQYWLPAAPLGTVFVVHGYFDHTALYGHLIKYLLDANFAVVAFDLPGHGLSDGEQVSIASFDHYVEVFDAILAAAKAHLPQPWHCVGQSTGGAIALKHLLADSQDKHLFEHIALLAPLLHPRRWHSNRWIYLLARRFLSRVKRSFTSNSGDQAFVDFLITGDPLQAQHIPLEWLGAMKRWTEEFHDLPISAYPLTIVQGDQDATLNWRYNLKHFTRKLPEANIRMIKGAQHHLVNERLELRDQVFAAMGLPGQAEQ